MHSAHGQEQAEGCQDPTTKKMTTSGVAGPNWENRTLFQADNLDVMLGMNSNTVDLIATDPPFNKNRDFYATPGSIASGTKFQDRWSWDHDVHPDWLRALMDEDLKRYRGRLVGGERPGSRERLVKFIESSNQTYGNSMGAYLCFMAVRLLQMHRILKPTGSIYLHCDPTASHYLVSVRKFTATPNTGDSRGILPPQRHVWSDSDARSL